MTPGSSGSMCEEKRRLLAEYEAATQAYFQSMTDLRAKTGTSQKAEYDRLWKETEARRTRSETARAALSEHIRRHKC